MKLSVFAVKQPVATWMLFLAFLILGLFSLTKLSIDMLPDIEPPMVSILTTWKGASASDIETEVTEPVEDILSSINNLDTITSKSMDNLSIVACKFDWGTNLDVASSDVRDKLEFTKRLLPADVEPPLLFKFSSSAMPVLTLTITADKTWPRLYHLTDTYIGDALKRVPGVGALLIYGGLKRRVNVYFNREQIEGYNLSMLHINKALAAENINMPAGAIKSGDMDHYLRVPARFTSMDDIRNTVIGYHKGQAVYLGDVADVSDGFEPPDLNAWGDGRPGIVLMIQKQTGKNTVDVINGIYACLDKLKKQLPPDVEIHTVSDNAEDILNSVKNLRGSLLWGIFFIVWVTIIFLRRVRPVLIIALIIPFSLMIAFVFMLQNGNTLNLISLMALAIASGMVVDNGIVVLENIIRHMENGESVAAASINGASEMGLAITASTTTTVIVFVPLMFLSGLAGILFKVLGFVLVVTLSASLLTALMFTPMLSAQWLKDRRLAKASGKGPLGRLSSVFEGGFRWVENQYQATLTWTLSHPLLVITVATVIFASSLSLVPFLSTSFFPKADTGDVSIRFRLSEGTRVEKTTEVVKAIMSEIDSLVLPEEMRHSYATDGKSEDGLAVALGFEQGPNVGQVTFKLVDRDKRSRSVENIADKLRERIRRIPGITRIQIMAQNKMTSAVMGNAKPVCVEIQSFDGEAGRIFALHLKNKMGEIPGLVDVNLTEKDHRPEMWVEIQKKKAAALGLNVATIAATLRNYYYGREATNFRDSGERFDVFTRLSESDKNDPDSLPGVPIFTPDGRMIRLGSVARIIEGKGPIEIERKNRQRVIRVEGDISGRSLGEISSEIKKMIRDEGTPPGISISFGGDMDEQKKAFSDLLTLLVLGIILVYMIMASLFRNLRDPFIVMFSVPFAFTGVIYAYYFTGTTLGVMSFMGVIMLMGIVVNNAIVLLDYIHRLRKKGISLTAAILEGGKSRLRPVLMTTLTTFFGMMPMAVSDKVGAEAWNPLGITMLGGLAVSTLVTLVLIPAIYYLFEKQRHSQEV